MSKKRKRRQKDDKRFEDNIKKALSNLDENFEENFMLNFIKVLDEVRTKGDMITCPICEKQISYFSNKCPNCSFPIMLYKVDLLPQSIIEAYKEEYRNRDNIKNELDNLSVNKCQEILQNIEADLKLNPESKDQWVAKGIFLKKLNRFDEAIKAYDEALAIDPEYKGAWYNKGLIYLELGKYEKALEMIDKAILLGPSLDDAWFNEVWYAKGNILEDLGRLEEAVQAYDKALERDPYYLEVWNNKVIVLKRMNRFKEAIQACDKILEFDPQNKNAHIQKQEILRLLEQNKSDMVWINKTGIIKQNKSNIDKSLDASIKETASNHKYQEDQKQEEKIIININTNPDGSFDVSLDNNSLLSLMDEPYKMGIEYLDRNLIDLAIIEFEKSVEVEDNKGLLYLKYEKLGDCYFDKEDFSRALMYYELSLKNYPPVTSEENGKLLTNVIYYKKAYTLKKAGRFKEAIADLEESLKQVPFNVDAWILKANCHNAMRQTEEAIKSVDEALKIDPNNSLALKNKEVFLRTKAIENKPINFLTSRNTQTILPSQEKLKSGGEYRPWYRRWWYSHWWSGHYYRSWYCSPAYIGGGIIIVILFALIILPIAGVAIWFPFSSTDPSGYISYHSTETLYYNEYWHEQEFIDAGNQIIYSVQSSPSLITFAIWDHPFEDLPRTTINGSEPITHVNLISDEYQYYQIYLRTGSVLLYDFNASSSVDFFIVNGNGLSTWVQGGTPDFYVNTPNILNGFGLIPIDVTQDYYLVWYNDEASPVNVDHKISYSAVDVIDFSVTDYFVQAVDEVSQGTFTAPNSGTWYFFVYFNPMDSPEETTQITFNISYDTGVTANDRWIKVQPILITVIVINAIIIIAAFFARRGQRKLTIKL